MRKTKVKDNEYVINYKLHNRDVTFCAIIKDDVLPDTFEPIRFLAVGISVRNPEDEAKVINGTPLGVMIARGRANKKPAIVVSTPPALMSNRFIYAIVHNYAVELANNFTNLIPLGKNASRTLEFRETPVESSAEISVRVSS